MVSTDKQLWNELEVDYTKITKEWEKKYKKTCKRILNKRFDEKDIDEIAESFGITIVGPNKPGKVDEIINLEFGKTVWMLYEFQKTKILVIEEFCSSATVQTRLPELALKETIMGQISLMFVERKELIREIYVLNNRRNLKSIKYHKSVIPITTQHIDTIIQNKNRLIKFLNKRDKENYKWKFYLKTTINNTVLLMFLRQINDKLEREIDRPKRKKTTLKCFIEFHLGEKDIQILCSRYVDWKSLEKGVEKILFQIPQVEECFNDFENTLYRQFKDNLCSEEAQSEIKIVEITFPRSELNGLPRLHLTDITRNQGLANSLQTLMDEEKIKIFTLRDISSLKIRYDNRTKSIQVNSIGPGLVELDLDTRGLDQEEINALKEKFKEVFGFPLCHPVAQPHNKQDLERLLSNIFSRQEVFNPQEYELKIISKLIELDLITCQERYYCVCTADPIHHKDEYSNPDEERCYSCHARIEPVKKVLKPLSSEPKISSFIKNILLREGISAREPIYKHKGEIKLISTTYKNRPCYFYVNCKPLPTKIISFFKASGLPIIFINVGSGRLSKKVQEYNMFKPVDLNYLIISTFEDNLPPSYFSELVKERIDLLYSNIVGAGESSYNRLNEYLSGGVGYDRQKLEDDSFNLLRMIFPNSQKWGKEYSSKPLPDGVGGLSINGTPRGCFTWDCKLAEGKETNGNFIPHMLNRGEKRAGREYIKRLCENKEITQYHSSKKLDAFIIISNCMNTTNFNNYAKHLSKTEFYLQSKKKWKGKVIYISTKTLLHLYRKYQAEFSRPELNQETLDQKISSLFLKKNRLPKKIYYDEITEEKIDEIINDYRASINSPPNINPNTLVED
ncbi:MAG: hypothetical protein WAX07_01900 [Candidatus Altiarchaeia archaeon]